MKTMPLMPPCSRGRLLAGWIASFLLAGLSAGQASAAVIQPYVQISVSASSISIEVQGVGTFNAPAPLTVKVAANTVHGGIIVMASPLVLSTDSAVTLPASQLFVKGPLTGTFKPLTAPINVTGPMIPGIFNILLEFQFNLPELMPAGEYTGVITITVAPPP